MIEFEKERERWAGDPLLCTYSLFIPKGGRLYKKQEDIIQSACINSTTLVASHHAAGKTHTAALVCLTFLFMYLDSKVITTAPSWSQVKFLLWAEVKNIWNRSPLVKKCESSNIKISDFAMMDTQLKLDEEWFGIGLSPKQDAGEDVNKRFTGYHAKKILAILDEGPAVAPSVWNAIDTLLTSHGSHLLAIGNPVESSGNFYNGFRNSDNNRIIIDIFGSPNFTANGVKDLKTLKKLAKLSIEDLTNKLESFKYPFPALVSPGWAIKMLKKWGATSPLFISRVLSKFPGRAKDTLISLADLEACTNESILDQPYENVLACDPARFGDDETVIMGYMKGKQVYKDKHQKRDLMYTANKLIALINEFKYRVLVVDQTGLGAGVVDRVREHFQDYSNKPRVFGVDFGGKPTVEYEKTCENIVTALYKMLDTLLKDRAIGVVDDQDLFMQLTGRKYDYRKGKYIVEEKKEYKKRTGQGSPDEADTLLLIVYGLMCAHLEADFFEGEDRDSFSDEY